MSSSGLIYAVIVGAWAAYLVPMWLRRQDELNEARPTERFSTAIRLLSGRGAMERRYAAKRGGDLDTSADLDIDAFHDADDLDPDPAPDHRDRAHPPVVRQSHGTPHAGSHGVGAHGGGVHGAGVHGAAAHGAGVHGAAHASAHVQAHAAADRTGSLARAKVLARRRRSTTVLFLAFTAGAIGAAVGGLGYLWAPAAPGVLLTLYIAHLRRAERHRFEFTMDQRRAAEAARRLRDRPHAPRPSAQTADRRALVEQTDHAEWIDQQQLPPDDGWDSAPVPMPTYVTAPVAPRTHGHPDLAGADSWSAARSTPAAPDPTPDARRRTPLFDQYAPPSFPAPDPLDRPRAANE
ncbi:divisome protein SepX/GlpR [Streptantibioticus silvisoli]|uniref:DUF1275 domain-containing protein n=1 Tax=Streptantibioticus silvisoli TaxID=2705255 RepID=A0ABT6W539_9ACTN|nr:gephyrin-like molybdotransferase receptor GlpR [Streptantibioticus silvisoli]MDI5965877.1 hypothetical protein [Streptantibioticus silvisoli]